MHVAFLHVFWPIKLLYSQLSKQKHACGLHSEVLITTLPCSPIPEIVGMHVAFLQGLRPVELRCLLTSRHIGMHIAFLPIRGLTEFLRFLCKTSLFGASCILALMRWLHAMVTCTGSRASVDLAHSWISCTDSHALYSRQTSTQLVFRLSRL
jgi:hypothetical protein